MTYYLPRVDDEPYSDPYVGTDPNGVFVSQNEDMIYQEPDWELLNTPDFLDDGSEPLAAGSRPFTSVSRGNGYATVRTNVTITFSGSVPFNGQVSGSLPAGTVFRGRDANGDGMPDLIGKLLRNGSVRPQ